jgi:hypothetical protein
MSIYFVRVQVLMIDVGISSPLLNNFPSTQFPILIQALMVDVRANNPLLNNFPSTQFAFHIQNFDDRCGS